MVDDDESFFYQNRSTIVFVVECKFLYKAAEGSLDVDLKKFIHSENS